MTALRDLQTLPKGHLHVHFEATMRPETYAELGAAQSSSPALHTDYGDFSDFQTAYMGLLNALTTPEAVVRVVDEMAEDAVRDGVMYIELGMGIDLSALVFGSRRAALEAMCDAIAAAGARNGIVIRLVVTVDRSGSPERAIEDAELAVEFANRGVAALGLANDERGFPGDGFAEAFRIAKAGGLLSTPHSGELEGPDYIRTAVEVLHADRVQHGVRVISDPDLIAQLAASGVCLDVCPTSNVLLGAVEGMDSHPLRVLLEAGVRCSINADDPTLLGPSILDEYELARHELGLSDEQLAACAWSSIDCSAAPDELKTEAHRRIDAWLSAAPNASAA